MSIGMTANIALKVKITAVSLTVGMIFISVSIRMTSNIFDIWVDWVWLLYANWFDWKY